MNKTLEIKVKSFNDDFKLPSYETSSSAGLDLRANLPNGSIDLNPKERKLIGTGLFFEIPEGYEIQIRPRSGLALKNGISVLNSPGTIDADYRGEIKILLINHGSETFRVDHGMRIAQMVVSRYERIEFKIVKGLSTSKRGGDGFGSTGTK
tara:strand:- start:282 stop:734 length:453 start_codon:yes stop_codon:yes gene_type:complete